jgi:hypothetical protein
MTFILTEELASRVLETVDAGLCSGVGKPIPGQMCVEAAVCYAMGLPHGDEPTCVSPAIRKLKIILNDANWSSNKARAKGMRRLAIIQLGSMGAVDDVEFTTRVSEMVIRKILPRALNTAALLQDDVNKKALQDAATVCENEGTESAAELARSATELAARAAAESARSAAESAARSAAWLAAELAAWSARSTACDGELEFFAEEVVQILINMDAPATKYLRLTEV